MHGEKIQDFLVEKSCLYQKKTQKIYIKNKTIKLLNCNLKDLCGSKLVLLTFILSYQSTLMKQLHYIYNKFLNNQVLVNNLTWRFNWYKFLLVIKRLLNTVIWKEINRLHLQFKKKIDSIKGENIKRLMLKKKDYWYICKNEIL